MYQAMDYGIAGAGFWDNAASSGNVLSSTQWHWDIYSGRHHELMNGNPDKVQTTGDGWNGEDFSVAVADDAGNVTLRLDARVLDLRRVGIGTIFHADRLKRVRRCEGTSCRSQVVSLIRSGAVGLSVADGSCASCAAWLSVTDWGRFRGCAFACSHVCCCWRRSCDCWWIGCLRVDPGF